MNALIAFLKKHYSKLVLTYQAGIKWVSLDGLVNMETSALLTMFLMLFFPTYVAAVATLLIVVGKCTLDKKRGHENETHDLICACIGIVIGMIFGLAHIAFVPK